MNPTKETAVPTNAPINLDRVNALEAAALQEIDASRRAVLKLATIVSDHLEEPQDDDRDKAWEVIRYLDAGVADSYAADLYLLTDPEQREAGALLEANARERRLTDPDGEPYAVSIPSAVSSYGWGDDLSVSWCEGDAWHVTRAPERPQQPMGRLPKVAEHPILRVALDRASMYGGPAGQAWAKRAERTVLAQILEALR